MNFKYDEKQPGAWGVTRDWNSWV